MIPRPFLASIVVASAVMASSLPACSQADKQADPQSGYRLQANSRVVLTDVTVLDKQGNPVQGLRVSDFHIFDNGKLQQVATFEEHHQSDAAPMPQSASAAGIYSNDYLAHPPRVLNIIFLDLTNISIEDQMFLSYQLGKFFDALSPDEPVAIYARTGGASILLQSFTSDGALLRAAVTRVMPRFLSSGREYLDDFQTLRQIELYLGQIPGRKNVLWFSGGSTLYLRPAEEVLSAQSKWRDVYDELESGRIAIYPIDARGLTTTADSTMLAQHALMSNVAEATGGRAIYDYNGLALAGEQIVRADGAYYTLTYSPREFVYDHKWHKVKVTVPEGDYTLRYRSGYFADGDIPTGQGQSRQRKRLLPSGETAKVRLAGNIPIVFQATVHEGTLAAPDSAGKAQPEKSSRGTKPFTVQYSLPLDAFAIETAAGKRSVTCGAAVVAFNNNGTMVAHHGEQIAFTLKDDAALHPAGKVLPVNIEVDLPKGDIYLYVAAWDIVSKRIGTLEIPYKVMSNNASQPVSESR